jgi:hypothetical protein
LREGANALNRAGVRQAAARGYKSRAALARYAKYPRHDGKFISRNLQKSSSGPFAQPNIEIKKKTTIIVPATPNSNWTAQPKIGAKLAPYLGGIPTQSYTVVAC